MVFYVTWDDSGLGYCMMGYNPCWPCPYMTEHVYPPSLRLEADPEDDKVCIIKEPGPGPVQCCLMTLTPGILFLPLFVWKARGASSQYSHRLADFKSNTALSGYCRTCGFL